MKPEKPGDMERDPETKRCDFCAEDHTVSRSLGPARICAGCAWGALTALVPIVAHALIYAQIEREDDHQIAKGTTAETDDAKSRVDWLECALLLVARLEIAGRTGNEAAWRRRLLKLARFAVSGMESSDRRTAKNAVMNARRS